MNVGGPRLIEAQKRFSFALSAYLVGKDQGAFDSALQQFREEVGRAAKVGMEHWNLWSTCGYWLSDHDDRIYCYSRALALLEREPDTFKGKSFFLAEYNSRMAESNAKLGRKAIARELYEVALIAARKSTDLYGDAATAGSGRASLEGRIAAALLLLDVDAAEAGEGES